MAGDGNFMEDTHTTKVFKIFLNSFGIFLLSKIA